jgi:hypothetical protein
VPPNPNKSGLGGWGGRAGGEPGGACAFGGGMFSCSPGLLFGISSSCCKPPRYVPYKGTYVPYDGTYGVPDQGQMLDV